MKRLGTIVVGAALFLGVLLLAGSGVVSAAESPWTEWKEDLPFRLSGEIEAGGQIVQPRGNSPTFDEYRDLDRTDRGGEGHIPAVPFFRLQGEDQARTRFLEFGGRNLTRMDANYYLNAGVYNYLRFNFEFDRIPHVIAHNAQTIYTESLGGIFRIPAAGAGPLATALNGVVAPITPAQRSAVESAVNSLLHPTDLGFQTDAAKFGFTWLPLPELEIGLGYSVRQREGHLPGGTVIGGPGSGVLELAVPRDERFHEVKAGAEYARDWYQVRFNYTYSMFENDVPKIEWDNPCGAGAGGCRNPSGLGRASTPPDNLAHTFSGGGGITLPWWDTRLTGGGSYSLWRQNETFLPWTTNPGFTGSTDDRGASSPDAKMDVLLTNLTLTTRPLRDVTTTTRYRYYELENHTPVHTFTGILSPGDTTPSVTSVETSEPLAFRRQNASQEIAWRILPPVTAKAGYEWEHWNRAHREVSSSNEHTFRGVMDLRPWRWLLGRFSYAHGVRTIHAGGYDETLGGNGAVLPQFRKFDEADRTRNRGDVLLQLTPLESVTITGTFNITQDNFFNSAYGLQDARSFGASAEVNWMPREEVNLFVGYAHDNYASQLQKRFITGTIINDPKDDFTVRPLDLLDSVNAGVNLALIPKRLDLGLEYSLSFGRSKMTAFGAPGGQAAGEPTVFPMIENLLHVFNVNARWYLTPQWTVKLGYQYERYWENDFTTDGVSPSLAKFQGTINVGDIRSIVLGAQHPSYEAHIVALSLAYKF